MQGECTTHCTISPVPFSVSFSVWNYESNTWVTLIVTCTGFVSAASEPGRQEGCLHGCGQEGSVHICRVLSSVWSNSQRTFRFYDGLSACAMRVHNTQKMKNIWECGGIYNIPSLAHTFQIKIFLDEGMARQEDGLPAPLISKLVITTGIQLWQADLQKEA